jgi:hypothetical protein
MSGRMTGSGAVSSSAPAALSYPIGSPSSAVQSAALKAGSASWPDSPDQVPPPVTEPLPPGSATAGDCGVAGDPAESSGAGEPAAAAGSLTADVPPAAEDLRPEAGGSLTADDPLTAGDCADDGSAGDEAGDAAGNAAIGPGLACWRLRWPPSWG